MGYIFVIIVMNKFKDCILVAMNAGMGDTFKKLKIISMSKIRIWFVRKDVIIDVSILINNQIYQNILRKLLFGII